MRMIEVCMINKLIARAVLLIGLLIMLPSAVRADPWCTQWKTNRCAPRSKISRPSQIVSVCEAQAKENPTVESVSRCTPIAKPQRP